MAEGKGRSEGQGLKLLYLRDYFYKETSKDHQKDIDQIIAFLDSQNVRASDKTLYSDFRQLREKLNVPIKYDGRTRKYYVTEPLYNSQELALLMDCVCNASFLTERDALRLMRIIKGLANIADRSMLAQRMEEYEKRRRIETSVIQNLKVLTDAIEQKRKVMFQKLRYVAEHTKHTEVEPYFIIASPLEVLRTSDGYELRYLVEFLDLPKEEQAHYIAYREKNLPGRTSEGIKSNEFFRRVNLSLLTNIKVLDAMAKKPKPKKWEDDEEWLREYEEFYKERAITIRFCKFMLPTIAEELGADAVLIEEDNYYFRTTIKRTIDEPFYDWFSRFAKYAKILSPQNAVDGYLEWCRRRMLEQEVLYKCDAENIQAALYDREYEPSDRERRICDGIRYEEWEVDYQNLGLSWESRQFEVHLPNEYDNSDEYDGDGFSPEEMEVFLEILGNGQR